MSVIDPYSPFCSSVDIPKELKDTVYYARLNNNGVEVKDITIDEIIVASSISSSCNWSQSLVAYSIDITYTHKYHKLKQFFGFKSEIITKHEKRSYAMFSEDFYSEYSPSGVLRLELIGRTREEAIRNLLTN